MPYPTKVVTLGFVEQQDVFAIEMPRADFLSLVEQTLDSSHLYDSIRDDMIATANTVARFPLNEWIDAQRGCGCGCLVGEYIVANDIITRERRVNEHVNVLDELQRAEPSRFDSLFAFGAKIDTVVRDHLLDTETITHHEYDNNDLDLVVVLV